MYVALQAEVLKSTDSGKSWSSLGRAPNGLVAMAVHPRRPDEVYAALAAGAIFKTVDGGLTWEQFREGPAPGEILGGAARTCVPRACV